MRNLTLVWVGLVAILGIVSGTLWSELRAERQLTSDLRARMAQAETSYPEPAQVQLPQSTIEAETAPVVSAHIPEPGPVVVAPEPPPAPTPAYTPFPLIERIRSDIERIPGTDAHQYQLSEITASARVHVWMERLAATGQPLTADQAQALNAAAIAEMRRETDETTELARNAPPGNAYTDAQTKYEFVDRQHATNLRILDAVAPDLTARQREGLRTQFESWHAGAKASARVELERTAAGL